MSIHGIISEYNPFHKGHEYMINQCKCQGASHVVVAMSGNFVQRGEPAIMDKWSRTKMALLCGADLVVEIPLAWSLSSAEGFARGGVEVLNSLGCVDCLSFGSESADLPALQELAKAAVMPETIENTKKYLELKINYPSARQKAIAQACGESTAQLLENANDILGVEYIKALNEMSSKIIPNPIRRVGVCHDSQKQDENYLSASQIRKQLVNGDFSCFDFMPNEVSEIINTQLESGRAPVDIKGLETSILSKLRVMDARDIKLAPDISEGLENRIVKCVKTSTTIDELYDSIKTKRYTHSRIRRIIMSLFLDLKASDSKSTLPYIRVLGFNEKGRELLKQAKQTATLPIIMKSSQIKGLNEHSQKTFKLECTSTDIYTLAMPKPLPCGMEMTENVVRYSGYSNIKMDVEA